MLAALTYWQNVQRASGLGSDYHWVLLGTLGTALLLRGLLPSIALRLRVTLMLILLSILGVLVCAWMIQTNSSEGSSAFRWIHFTSQWALAIGIINLAGMLIFRVLLVGLRLPTPPILRDTILGLAYIVVAISLLGRHQVDLSGIIATSAVVTAVIGFSLQDTLGNIMGGVALQMERSIGVGDWVRIGETEGVVHEIRWRQTSIETRNWDTIVIPNSVLMKSQVTVLGRRAGMPRQHRMTIAFNVDYRFSPADVTDIVQSALRGEPIQNVATQPPPDCVLAEFKESFGMYSVRYWLTDLVRDSSTNSEVRTRIFLALKRAGMSLSIPAQTVFMTMDSNSRRQRKHEEELARRVAALKDIVIFQTLTDEERRDIADRLTVAPFRRGELMTRQGNVAHFLYIIIRGEGEVRYDPGDGTTHHINNIKAGDVFGEMGLLTGEPRSATVVALSDTVCYKLDRADFADALKHRPVLAEEIAQLLSQRRAEFEAAKAGVSLSSRKPPDTTDLLRRIRGFFHLE